jgi:hypothetical protein
MDENGEETVDEDTYSFNAFDLVLLPACKDARLQLAESLDMNKAKFDAAINEALESCDEDGKKIIRETLDNLKFTEDTSSEIKEEEPVKVEKQVADNDGTSLVDELQEALKENHSLKNNVVALNEKLSVSYTKEVKLEEEVTRLKDTVRRLAESVRKSSALSNQLQTMKSQLEEQSQLAAQRAAIIESYKQKISNYSHSRLGLKESLSSKDKQVSVLETRVQELTENLSTVKKDSATKVESLRRELEELKADSQIKNSQYSSKLTKSNELVENYRNIAKTAVDRYIQSKALNLGISVAEIKNRLNENYSFDDIDEVCESLRSYKRNMSKLPFSLGSKSVDRVTLKEDTSTQRFTNPDDVVDTNLFNLIND